MLLGAYALVFGVIFAARVPDGLDIPYVAWLAVGLWPWLAFSESILRSSQSVVSRAQLLHKVSVHRYLFPVASHFSAFIIHIGGYALVLLTLKLLGLQFSIGAVPYLLLLLVSLYILSLSLGMLCAALIVFFRDLEQFLPTIFLFWFFLTPILYSASVLPEGYAYWLNFNPLTWWMEEIRAALFDTRPLPGLKVLGICLVSIVALIAATQVFTRLSKHFEDFL